MGYCAVIACWEPPGTTEEEEARVGGPLCAQHMAQAGNALVLAFGRLVCAACWGRPHGEDCPTCGAVASWHYSTP